jgi:PAS domain S-box-containing protein
MSEAAAPRPRRRLVTLKLRIAAILAASLIPGAIILAVTLWTMRHDLIEESFDAMNDTSQAAAGEVVEHLSFTHALLDALASGPVDLETQNQACEPAFREALQNIAWMTSLWTTDAKGQQVCTWPPPQSALSRADRTDFQDAMKGAHMAIGAARRGQLTGEFVVPASVPLRNADGVVIGTLGVGLRLATLMDGARSLHLPEDSVLSLVSAEGIILWRFPDRPGSVGGRPLDPAVTEQLREAWKASTDGKSVGIGPLRSPYRDGVERIVTGQSVPQLGLWVIAAFNVNRATEVADRIAWLTAVAFLLILASAFIGITLGVERTVVHRLRRVSHQLNRINLGLVRTPEPRGRTYSEIDQFISKILRTGYVSHRRREAHKAAAAQLRSILDSSIDGIIMISDKGTVISFNRTAEKIFGYDRSEVIGKNVSMLMPQPYRSGHDGYLANYMSGGQPKVIGIGRTVEGLRRDGTTFPMDLGVSEVPDTGNGRLFVGSVRDVSRRLELEAQLREHQKMEALGQLTGGIAHDFNNLLAVILGNLEVMLDYLPDGSLARGAVDTAIRATDNAASLTQRLLAFARRMPLKPQLVEINQLIADGVELYRRALGENVQVETHFGPGPLRVSVDPAQLQVALLNLAVNARDAMPRGGMLTISTGRDTMMIEGKVLECVVIAITDNGSGMTPEVLAKATQPFFTTKEPGAGTGLGLSMVHGFAAQSGGALSIESAVGIGTAVRLFLPLNDHETVELDDEDPVLALEVRPPLGTTVLVVEDNAEVRETVATMLRIFGYMPLLAPDGESAVTLLGSTQRIDLVLTDMVLPGSLNGLDVAHAARRLRPEIGILCMSGYTDPLRGVDPKAVAEFSLLSKPFTRQQLGQALKQARR